MQGINIFVVLVIVALFGLVFAAPAEELSGVEQLPAMLVRSGPAQLALGSPQPRQCTNAACANLCRALGWTNGFCLDTEWCLCYN
ncbi:defensin-like [Cydia fagiglandana]|uniref:defensin-like n=1 Tax=Cydia fagiglandana TaxID=1458189 RepID=UPI002FEE57D1